MCERLVVAFGYEYRVVAEAFRSLFPCGYGAADDAFEECEVGFVVVACECYDGAELCLAVVVAVEPLQQFAHVCLGVVVGAFGVACRVHSGFAAECFHFKSGVVGEAVDGVVVGDVACFLYGVAFEGVGCLRDVGVAAYVGE